MNFIIALIMNFSLCLAQPVAEDIKQRAVEAIGYLDIAPKSAATKDELFLYESSEKKSHYPLVIKNKKLYSSAIKLKGQLVKVTGKLVFNEQSIGETKKKYTTIIAEDIQHIKLFDNFITDEVAYNRLYPPQKTADKPYDKQGASVSGNAAAALIFIGGAALVGTMVHDLSNMKNNKNNIKQ